MGLDDIASGINEMSSFFKSGVDLDNKLSDDEGQCQSGYRVSTLGVKLMIVLAKIEHILWIDIMPSEQKLCPIFESKMFENWSYQNISTVKKFSPKIIS